MYIHINVGSNEQKEENIAKALELLGQEFDEIEVSSIYTSPSVGFKGDDFANVGVNATTAKSLAETMNALRAIEDTIGRDRTKPKFSSRTIDLDLIIYGNIIDREQNIPRDDLLKYDFVLTPFIELLHRK